MPKLTYRTPKMSRDHNTAVVYLDGQRIRLDPWRSDEAKEAFDRLVAEWLANQRRLTLCSWRMLFVCRNIGSYCHESPVVQPSQT